MKKTTLVLTLLCGALTSGCTVLNDTPSDEATTDAAAATTGAAATGEAPTGTTGEAPTGTTDESASTTGEVEGQCDPWLQDCPGGYKCMAFAEEGEPAFTGTKCTPVVPNPGTEGDPCTVEGGWWTGVDDCDYGHACWNIDHATNTGVCVALCTGNQDSYDCPDDEDACVFWVPGLAHVCLETCDPLLQDCSAAQACGPEWAGGAQQFTCYAEYSGTEGQEFDPCMFGNMCDPGLICWDPAAAIECAADAYCCLSYCDLDNPQCNGQGAECVSFYSLIEGQVPPAHADVGICVLPG
jgi:hypothetical protein